MTQDALVFDVDQKRFGIWSAQIKQLVRAVAITTLPGAPGSIEGVINCHGTIVSVLNFRGLFGLPAKELELSDNLILLQMPDAELAIRVDTAVDLIPIDDAALAETQVTIDGTKFSRTIAKTSVGLVYLLDVEQLLGPEAGLKLNEFLATRTQGAVHDDVSSDRP